MKKITFLVPIIAVSFSILFSEEVVEQLTLTESLNIAYKNHIKMIETRKEIDAAKGRLIQAKAYPNPEAEIQVYASQDGNQNDAEIGLYQEIEILGKRGARVSIAQTETEILDKKLNSIWAEVRFEVKNKYNELLLAQRKKELATENLNLARNFLDNLEMKYELGEAFINELIRAKIEIVRAENELLETEKQISICKSELNLLLNRPPDYKFIPVDELVYLKKSLNSDKLTEKALTQNPELKVKTLSLELEKNKLNLIKKELIPNPSIGIIGKQENEKGIGVELSLSLPLWYRKEGEIVEVKSELEKINTQIDYEKKELELKIINAFIEAELSDKQVMLLKRALEEANELLRVITLRYKEGKSNFLTYLESLITLKNTKLYYYETVLNYNQKIALIEKIINEELR